MGVAATFRIWAFGYAPHQRVDHGPGNTARVRVSGLLEISISRVFVKVV